MGNHPQDYPENDMMKTKQSTSKQCVYFMGYSVLSVQAREYFNDLAQDCGISTGKVLEIPQPCTKPSMLNQQYIQAIFTDL